MIPARLFAAKLLQPIFWCFFWCGRSEDAIALGDRMTRFCISAAAMPWRRSWRWRLTLGLVLALLPTIALSQDDAPDGPELNTDALSIIGYSLIGSFALASLVRRPQKLGASTAAHASTKEVANQACLLPYPSTCPADLCSPGRHCGPAVATTARVLLCSALQRLSPGTGLLFSKCPSHNNLKCGIMEGMYYTCWSVQTYSCTSLTRACETTFTAHAIHPARIQHRVAVLCSCPNPRLTR